MAKLLQGYCEPFGCATMTQRNVIPISKGIELKHQREQKEKFDAAKRNLLKAAEKLTW